MDADRIWPSFTATQPRPTMASERTSKHTDRHTQAARQTLSCRLGPGKNSRESRSGAARREDDWPQRAIPMRFLRAAALPAACAQGRARDDLYSSHYRWTAGAPSYSPRRAFLPRARALDFTLRARDELYYWRCGTHSSAAAFPSVCAPRKNCERNIIAAVGVIQIYRELCNSRVFNNCSLLKRGDGGEKVVLGEKLASIHFVSVAPICAAKSKLFFRLESSSVCRIGFSGHLHG